MFAPPSVSQQQVSVLLYLFSFACIPPLVSFSFHLLFLPFVCLMHALAPKHKTAVVHLRMHYCSNCRCMHCCCLLCCCLFCCCFFARECWVLLSCVCELFSAACITGAIAVAAILAAAIAVIAAAAALVAAAAAGVCGCLLRCLYTCVRCFSCWKCIHSFFLNRISFLLCCSFCPRMHFT